MKDQPTDSATDSDADPGLQGEGGYTAARRHRESVETFVESGPVEAASRKAEPATLAEAREPEQAEQAGQAPAGR